MGMNKDFFWGAATASIQIEGGAHQDGRKLTNWDVFCEADDRIRDGHNALVGSDHYNHMEEDVALMKEMGLNAYRFSISWSRILPDGTGKINGKGLAFYSRLVDELLKNNITPFITLYHWDLPYALHLQGGWLNPNMPAWVEGYARAVVDALSDRVTEWITLNEPQCFVYVSYYAGRHAPGYQVSDRELALCLHNSLLAHGKMVYVLRQFAKRPAKIGFTQATPLHSIPYTNKPEDVEAARNRQFSLGKHFGDTVVTYTDPIYLGRYPDKYLKKYEAVLPEIRNDDMKLISQKLDYHGINLYGASYVRADENGQFEVVPHKPGYARTAYYWPMTPEGMYWSLRFFYERYQVPILVTENGMSGTDWVHRDGKVHDADRIDFIYRHLTHMKKAMDEGIDIRGYFHWSLLDNFEWAMGYAERFGLIYVDFETGKRTIKDSGFAYRDIIASQGDILV